MPYYPQPNAKLPGFAITRLVAALHLAQTQNQTRTPAL
ncbi:amino acid oxidase [Acetobacter orientalis]|uniref:Amino acid oxidase, partial n=1 Tax=Acetobacter orientalis TaxID=146474 RepID=A0A2Z5ZLX1_9PROT|nr:amino acid oxidase [Acetobacter orientalis]